MTLRCIIISLLLVVLLCLAELVHTRHLKGLKKPARREEKQSAYSSRENLLWNLILTEKNSPKKKDTRSRHSIYRQHKDQHSTNQQLEMERQVHDHNTENITRIKKFPLTLGLCNDQSPRCAYFALNGLCDSPGPFEDLQNIQINCPFSCGYCKDYIPGGEVDFVGEDWNTE
ncbi:uncharacterized protein LOC122946976 [Acropora millepora]|uniref:uncharacterized protein LOC122946976 n=1 Tax=Acropora millepora TaxID=45264 RepID=UPI001CF44573|nr:uncharacterized protein LOC122946976 [Acropora millepora]